MPTISKLNSLRRTRTRTYSGGFTESYTDTQAANNFLKIWTNTPNYRAMRASHTPLPTNRLVYLYQEGVGGNAGYVWGSDRYTFSPGFYIFPPATTGSDAIFASLASAAAAQLIERAKGSQWNAPVFVAEARKTSAMVYQRAHHLVSMAQALRRGNITHFFKLFHPTAPPPPKNGVNRFNKRFGTDPRGAAANAWLEYTYGWTPFMNDVRSAVNTLMDVVDRPDNRIGRVFSQKKSHNESYTPELIGYAWEPFLRGWIQGKVLTDLSYRLTWYFKPSSADLPGRFGLTNPAEVIWELVPFSFVADWFLPIGDYLKSLDAPWRFVHHGGAYGAREEYNISYSPTRAEGWNYVYGGYSKSRTLGVYRGALDSIPMPTLASMSFEADVGARRAISSIALLRQQMLRLQPSRPNNFRF